MTLLEDSFATRHIGPNDRDIEEMLKVIGVSSISALVEHAVPEQIRLTEPLVLPRELTEHEALRFLKEIAHKNSIWRSYIGQGYYNTNTPAVIQRKIFENPGWYTQYTPYQAEISQGRLEALVNFQTMVEDLTGLDVANASLLDEGTAAAEAMTLSLRRADKMRNVFLVADSCHPQTIEVIKTRAEAIGVKVDVVAVDTVKFDSDCFGLLIQYPDTRGYVGDYRSLITRAHERGVLVTVATDLLALCYLECPGTWGADIAVGSSQRFGVPMGFGGPHAAFFACKEEYLREMPGRIIGVSKDANGASALRLAVQTREQHIRRERATSNICTAQVLLAVMSSMYAVYHGPEGLKKIARRVAAYTKVLAEEIKAAGGEIGEDSYFDTLLYVGSKREVEEIRKHAENKRINLFYRGSNEVQVSIDETVSIESLVDLIEIFTGSRKGINAIAKRAEELFVQLVCQRKDSFLKQAVFNSYHSESEMLRYIQRLEEKDLSLTRSMIPLGSCTMKLNAASEMLPISWPEFSSIHPFVPDEQSRGYQELFDDLEKALCELTGFKGISLQPNAGSQGEYTGLLVIRAYQRFNGEHDRKICLIPTSAHGTNPASAVMVGMEVVQVKCDELGNIDVNDLKERIRENAARLSCLMVTYPSTHGVFEESIREICALVHEAGGQVYMDGANMNAQVGLCSPGEIGADVCHLNLHKTFSIPHGGGGPGVGPIGVAAHLVEFLPGHIYMPIKREHAVGAVCSAAYGSAGILAIPWMYIKMMGSSGLKQATEIAILNANYVAARLQPYYPVLYRGKNGLVAHECILDCRRFKRANGVEAGDIAKRLMDYGFHAPTVSFPVVETLMVEPTESESKAELDRFCDAMIAIRKEIEAIEEGKVDKTNNLLKNSPHTAECATSSDWLYSYTREEAVYPLSWLKERKFWPSVRRIDNVYGDRNLITRCC